MVSQLADFFPKEFEKNFFGVLSLVEFCYLIIANFKERRRAKFWHREIFFVLNRIIKFFRCFLCQISFRFFAQILRLCYCCLSVIFLFYHDELGFRHCAVCAVSRFRFFRFVFFQSWIWTNDEGNCGIFSASLS